LPISPRAKAGEKKVRYLVDTQVPPQPQMYRNSSLVAQKFSTPAQKAAIKAVQTNEISRRSSIYNSRKASTVKSGIHEDSLQF
jgi:hypothetical protein